MSGDASADEAGFDADLDVDIEIHGGLDSSDDPDVDLDLGSAGDSDVDDDLNATLDLADDPNFDTDLGSPFDLTEDPNFDTDFGGPIDLGDDPNVDTEFDSASDDVAFDSDDAPAIDTSTDISVDTLFDSSLDSDDSDVSGADLAVDVPDATPDSAIDTTADAVADTEVDANGVVCGDDTCDASETCVTCESDCGVCSCDRGPADLAVDSTRVPEFGSSGDAALSTWATLEVNGQVSAGESLDTCTQALFGSGDLSFCASVLGTEVCASDGLRVQGECTAQLECLTDREPEFTCDSLNYCCAGQVEAEIDTSATVDFDARFGALDCAATVNLNFSAQLDLDTEEGAGCTCSDGADHGLGTGLFAGVASASCQLDLYGGRATEVQVDVCGWVDIEMDERCQNQPTVTGGAQVEIHVPETSLQWLTIGAYRQTWGEANDDCP